MQNSFALQVVLAALTQMEEERSGKEKIGNRKRGKRERNERERERIRERGNTVREKEGGNCS